MFKWKKFIKKNSINNYKTYYLICSLIFLNKSNLNYLFYILKIFNISYIICSKKILNKLGPLFKNDSKYIVLYSKNIFKLYNFENIIINKNYYNIQKLLIPHYLKINLNIFIYNDFLDLLKKNYIKNNFNNLVLFNKKIFFLVFYLFNLIFKIFNFSIFFSLFLNFCRVK